MQYSIDSAKRSYLLRTNLNNTPNQSLIKPEPVVQTPKEVLMDKSAAFLAGASITFIVRNLKQFNSNLFLTSLNRLSSMPSETKSEEIANKILVDMKLKQKGVKIVFTEDKEVDKQEVSKMINKNYFGALKKRLNKDNIGVLDRVTNFLAGTNANLIGASKKASYLIHQKCAVTGKNISPFIFHELGHAYIAENKNTRPLLTLGKKLPVFAALVGFATLWHTPLRKDSPVVQTRWEKTKDFVDRNIAPITFVSCIPLLVEKSLASKFSLAAAKKYLPPSEHKALKKLYTIGTLTYAATSLAAAAGIGIGNKVQNNIIKQKHTPQEVYNLLI